MAGLNTSSEEMVRQFHRKFGHYTSATPTLDIPIEVKRLRYKLIKEEVDETFVAMGFFSPDEHTVLQFHEQHQNLDEIADGIADAIYVLVGTAVSYGIPIDRIFREVHRSNMTKTAVKAKEGEKYGTKTPKGPDYIAPNIKGILTEPQKHTRLEIVG